MFVFASFASQIPAGIGAVAACMAIGGFISQAPPAIRKEQEDELRRHAAIGGIAGLGFGLVATVLSVTLPI